jgi:hypothetical protein
MRVEYTEIELQQQAERIAAVERALAEPPRRFDPSRRTREPRGPSVVFSFRLDPREVLELERRAAMLDIKPTVLARNLVRCGLERRSRDEIAPVVDRLEAAIAELRYLVP